MSSTSIPYFQYTRKSTDRDDHQVKSLDDQNSVLRNLARREGLRVDEEFSEAASAKAPHTRQQFMEMIRKIERGRGAGILVWHVNRLFRNPYDAGVIQQLLQDGKIACIRTPERCYYPEDNALLLAVESGMANQYSRDLKRDVGRGCDEKAKRGWWPFRPPPGYQVHPITKNVEPKEPDFTLLRRAWDLMLTGAYTVPQVLCQLNEWGFRLSATKGKPGRPLSRTSLYRVFDNAFYMGEFRYRGEVIQGNHRAMVSSAEFRRVQQILKRESLVQPKKHLFPFTGFVRCGVCGCLITAEIKTKHYKTTGRSQEYLYYHCTGRKGCVRTGVSESIFDKSISQLIQSCQVDPDMVRWAIDTINEDWHLSTGKETVTESAQDTEEKRLQRCLEAVFDMREQGEISTEEFLRRKGRHEAALAAVRDVNDSSTFAREERHAEIVRKLRLSIDVDARYRQGNPQEKREIALAAASSYVLTLGKLQFAVDPLFDVLRTFEPSRSGPEQIGEDPPGPNSSAWRTFRDSIRNLIDQPGGVLCPTSANVPLRMQISEVELDQNEAT